jgi:hypothetical protein
MEQISYERGAEQGVYAKDKKDGNCGWKTSMDPAICIHTVEDRVERGNKARARCNLIHCYTQFAMNSLRLFRQR